MELSIEYNADDPLWLSRADLATVLNRTTRRIDQLREQCDYRFDHKADNGEVLIYAPGIIAYWHRASELSDDDRRLKKAHADLAEEKLRAMRAAVVPLIQIQADYALVGSTLRANMNRLCPHCREMALDGLASIPELNGHNEHSPRSKPRRNPLSLSSDSRELD